MKKLFVLFVIFFPISLFAQNNYLSMAIDGKSWTVKHTKYDFFGDVETHHYYIDGDTVIKDILWKRLLMKNDKDGEMPILMGYIHEVGLRVYHMDAYNQGTYIACTSPRLLYDFGLDVGEEVSVYQPYSTKQYKVKALTVDTIAVSDVSLRRIGLTTVGSDANKVEGYWVQGIGSNGSLVEPGAWGRINGLEMLSCSLDDSVLFTYSDFGIEPTTRPDETERIPYHPMLKEGKRWNYVYHQIDHLTEPPYYEEKTFEVSYVLRGDTMIGNERAFKMYQESEGRSKYHSAWMEKDRKVYMAYEGISEMSLLYDFSMICGSEFWNNEGLIFYLDKVDTLVVNGNRYNRYWFNDVEETPIYTWIEGVCGFDGIFYPSPYLTPTCLCDYEKFISCYEDGVQIYPQINIPDAISSIPSGKKTDEIIYDLQGHKVLNPQRGGLYIKNGKKFIMK